MGAPTACRRDIWKTFSPSVNIDSSASFTVVLRERRAGGRQSEAATGDLCAVRGEALDLLPEISVRQGPEAIGGPQGDALRPLLPRGAPGRGAPGEGGRAGNDGGGQGGREREQEETDVDEDGSEHEGRDPGVGTIRRREEGDCVRETQGTVASDRFRELWRPCQVRCRRGCAHVQARAPDDGPSPVGVPSSEGTRHQTQPRGGAETEAHRTTPPRRRTRPCCADARLSSFRRTRELSTVSADAFHAGGGLPLCHSFSSLPCASCRVRPGAAIPGGAPHVHLHLRRRPDLPGPLWLEPRRRTVCTVRIRH
mmetsp:Transcript_7073/g.13873  ORF Transcript_7073/g.13873 Transcript_7073/m.13873 type:complete len:310 (-) Transcript_7073:134-1063(-)